MHLRDLSDLSEEISAAFARSRGVTRYATWHLLRLQDEAADLQQSWVELNGQRGFAEEDGRRETFAGDLADVLVEVLVLAKQYDIDLEAELTERARHWSELAAE